MNGSCFDAEYDDYDYGGYSAESDVDCLVAADVADGAMVNVLASQRWKWHRSTEKKQARPSEDWKKMQNEFQCLRELHQVVKMVKTLRAMQMQDHSMRVQRWLKQAQELQ